MAEDKGPTATGGSTSSRSQREEKVLQFWKDNSIFDKTLEKESPQGDFIFYEGPPTANGLPGIHHIESRAFKDAIPRYKTMQGYRVPRRAGWDTHGLPVELQVEKQIGTKNKKDIEEFGIEKFNKLCRESVGTYINEWRRFTDRIGYWVNFDDAYYTYNTSYIEKVWGILAHVESRKLLYKDYKVVPWCPRCGTALSSHELAQGYQDVKDLSLYVRFELISDPDTYLLAWTTTPWTLPGNIALAVGADIDYVLVQQNSEKYILAESRLSVMPGEYEVVKKMKGKDLEGLVYKPLYPFVSELAKDSEKEKLPHAFKVYTADFVTTEDGTGIVHTAVMYGQEDFDLGTKKHLPKVHLVQPDGTFVAGTDWLSGRSVVDETLAVDILKDLQARGFYFNKENHLHSYPFCWRCKTRLIYYARDSWYIRMSSLRDDLIAENEKINWEPDYIKRGRFGEWLREVKDWAISRERYWGTPLPVWIAGNGDRMVVDSVETLKKYTKKSGNIYLVMRHGGTDGNRQEVVSYAHEASDHLTEEGREGVKASASVLKGADIDVIIASPFARTAETAEIVKEVAGFSGEIVFDDRLKEINPGDYDGKNWFDYHNAVAASKDWFKSPVSGGESYQDVLKRVGALLAELEAKYQGKKILLVTHGGPAWLMFVAAGFYAPESKPYEIPDKTVPTQIFVPDFTRFQNAEVRELAYVPLPHNDNFEVDLHRPYIDNVILVKDGSEYIRVKEVVDVWMDSGAMPFAQSAGQSDEEILYPADFISEGIDQTRGWFYTLHAIGVLMERGKAYNNVICLGHILDKDGKKMSKSLGNTIDPWMMIEKYGVDTVRLWMYSVNQPGEPKNFDERTLAEIEKRIFNMVDNIYAFYELYRDKEHEKPEFKLENVHILDSWILARQSVLIESMTRRLDAYQLLEPVREIRDFVDDLSTWYVRRSRDRLKEGDANAKQTLYFVLVRLSRLLGPFAPFAAEELYQKLRLESMPLSVHMCDWPKADETPRDYSENILRDMKETRRVVSLALEARQKANIKIRQPLETLHAKTELTAPYLEVIRDELNVKTVILDTTIEGDVHLNTTLTPELLEEGEVREAIRAIQEMRKEKNLTPKDMIDYAVPVGKEALFEKYRDDIVRVTNSRF